ncbi:MAG: response regulator transcription factor [Gaiellaceae bacterium]
MAGTVSVATRALGATVDAMLDRAAAPVYLLSNTGRIEWMNHLARNICGDLVGKQYTLAVAPESRGAAQRAFARKVVGQHAETHEHGSLLAIDGRRRAGMFHAIAVHDGNAVVGVFGIVALDADDEQPAVPDVFAELLTPRQHEVLDLLGRGASTKAIAESLSISTETVRNHIRRILRALGVHSRLEAVAKLRRRQKP